MPISSLYLTNSSNGYTSNFTSAIEAKSLKVGPRFENFPENFRDATDTKMVMNKVVAMDTKISNPNFQFNTVNTEK